MIILLNISFYKFSRNQVYNNTGVSIVSMLGFEKITAPFPAVEMNSFRNNRAVGELNQQLFDRFVFILIITYFTNSSF
jgi:hypothetical protein